MAKPRSKLPVHDVASAPANAEDGVSRRGFVGVVTWGMVSAALAACGGGGEPTNPGGGGGGGGGGGSLPAGVTVSGNVTTIDLSQQPGLAATNGFLLIEPPHVFIFNTGNNAYRAFTSVCTHEGCDVNNFSGGRINCPCHGSQFDVNGQPVAGPAPRALTEFQTAFTASTNRVTVTKP